MKIDKQKTWIGSPTKNQVIWICLIWIIGFGLSLAAMTNLFTVDLRNRHNLILGFISITSFSVVVIVLANYFKKRS